MNLKDCTDQDRIRMLAELAGIILPNGELVEGYCWHKGHISYDAIIPLIQKLSMVEFLKFICALLPKQSPFNDVHTFEAARIIYFATPTQLADALLLATRKVEI